MKRTTRRGQAAVEMSVMMVVVIPLIFYAMFLQDLLYYRLDQAEAIYSTPMDFMIINFQKEKGANNFGDIQHAARLTFADHTSAYNTYGDVSYDTADDRHHNGVIAAHECWVAGGGSADDGEKQVTCSWEKPAISSVGEVNSWAGEFVDPINGGNRLFRCTARLGVVNKFLPQQFMQNFAGKGGGGWSQVDLTDKTKFEGNTGLMASHGGGASSPNITNSDQYIFEREHYAVVHDPWALNDKGIPPLMPSNTSKGHIIYDRALNYWNQSAKGQQSSSYVQGASAAYDSQMDVDNQGDHVPVPPMHWVDETQRQNLGHFSSGWDDPRHPSAATPQPIYMHGML